MIDQVQTVLLAGGFGTRLWPLSQQAHSKQFLKLIGDKSLLEQMLTRLQEAFRDPPVIVCNHSQETIAEKQWRLANVEPRKVLLEPTSLGTAGAIALAAIREISSGQKSLMLAMPVDSYFEETCQFSSCVEASAKFALQGKIIMFGIPPRSADTNYGYVRVENSTEPGISEVLSFEEKPTSENAKNYFDSGEYLWNSGIYLFRPQDYMDELEKFRPDLLAACYKVAETGLEDSIFMRYESTSLAFSSESVDRAVMENTAKAVIKVCDMKWVDLGSWRSLFESQQRDANENVIVGNAISFNTKNWELYTIVTKNGNVDKERCVILRY
ncbi:MAG: sugar phosphate nucleotidyltransferase [Gammaproteobacteria bacterium]|nr:sugar phosphate nucleotidyltransferase [Gammaproteobacteria bacterium]MCY4228887.1 sugar phosphate nucleotidyltransferase [Gammaproteobacteria bacterium]